jgi:hypothetical protein
MGEIECFLVEDLNMIRLTTHPSLQHNLINLLHQPVSLSQGNNDFLIVLNIFI